MSRSRIVWMLFFALLLGAGAAVFFFRQGLDTYQANFAQPSLQQQARAAKQAVKLFGLQQISTASSQLKGAQLSAVFGAQGEERKKLAAAFLGTLGSAAEGKVSPAFSALSDDKAALLAASKNAPEGLTLGGVEEAAKGVASQGVAMSSGKAYLLVHVPVIGVPGAAPAAPKKAPGAEDKKEEDKEDKEDAPPPRRVEKKKCSKGRTWACLKICVKRKGRKCVERKEKCDCYRLKKKKSSSLFLPTHQRFAQAADDDAATPAPKAAAPAPTPRLLGIFSLAFSVNGPLAYQLKSSVFGAATELVFFLSQGRLLGSTVSKQEAAIQKLLGSAEGKSLLDMNKQGSSFLLGTDAYNAVSIKMGDGKLGLMVMHHRGGWENFLQQNIILMGSIAGGFVLLLLLLLLPGAGKAEKQLFDLEEQLLDLYRTGNLQVAFNEGSSGAVGSLAATLNRVFFQLRNQVMELQEASIGDFPRDNESTLSLSSPEVQMALNDPESHYRQVFQRYASAKEQIGEDISMLDRDRFLEKLRQNASAFRKQYDCLGVAFDVTVKDNKVILKPQLIPLD